MKERSLLARNLRAARRQLGLTQTQVAAKLGVHPITVSNWERGQFQPDDQTLEALADLYQQTSGTLLNADEDTRILLMRSGPDGLGWATIRPSPRVAVGERLRQERQRVGVSPEDAVHGTGYSVSSLLSWERGDTPPPTEMLFYLADRYNSDATWIFEGRQEERRAFRIKEDAALPQDAYAIREEALLTLVRRGATEADIEFLRELLSGVNVRRLSPHRRDERASDDTVVAAMKFAAAVLRGDQVFTSHFPSPNQRGMYTGRLHVEERRGGWSVGRSAPEESERGAELEPEPIPAPRGSGNFEDAASKAASDKDSKKPKPKRA